MIGYGIEAMEKLAILLLFDINEWIASTSNTSSTGVAKAVLPGLPPLAHNTRQSFSELKIYV